jgi:hypothetical protein
MLTYADVCQVRLPLDVHGRIIGSRGSKVLRSLAFAVLVLYGCFTGTKIQMLTQKVLQGVRDSATQH